MNNSIKINKPDVYIVIFNIPYEGTDIIKVFSKYEDAFKYADNIAKTEEKEYNKQKDIWEHPIEQYENYEILVFKLN